MKVYHILDHFIPIYSGYAFRSKYIMQFQRKWGIDASAIISPKHSQNLKKNEVIDDIPCTRMHIDYKFLGKIPYLREFFFLNFFKKRILETIKENPPDILHSHSPILCGIPALNAARKAGIPVIYELRSLWEDSAVSAGVTSTKSLRYILSKQYETNLLKKVDGVITICEGLKQEIVKRGIPEEKIHVTPNGVDPQTFLPRPPCTELIAKHKLEGKKIIGFFGSFYNYEGLYDMVQAMPTILKEDKSAVLLLGGKGEEEDVLKSLVEKLQIQDSVIFLGQVEHKDVLSYYSIMDIVVYPRKKSRLTDLVTPLKPLEAMSMGKAVLGSSASGIMELIQDQKTGSIFQAGNSDSLAQQCLDLLKYPEKRKELGVNAREYILKHRNWENIVREHVDVYQKLLERKK